jgi:hypothetical protein
MEHSNASANEQPTDSASLTDDEKLVNVKYSPYIPMTGFICQGVEQSPFAEPPRKEAPSLRRLFRSFLSLESPGSSVETVLDERTLDILPQ